MYLDGVTFSEFCAGMSVKCVKFVVKLCAMQQNIRGIVLRVIKYSDTQSVVTIFSRESGRVSFLSPSGNTREAARRRAILVPFGAIEGILTTKSGSDFGKVSDLIRGQVRDFTFNPIKSIIALFLSDVLYVLLKEQQPDSLMYDYLEVSSDTLGRITNRTAIANFHISFLLGLIRLLGIEPDISTYSSGKVLDMRDGVWRNSAPFHSNFLDPVRSRVAATIILKMNMRNMHLFKFTREERNEVVDAILSFLSLHVANLSGVKSLDVVRGLF